MTPARDTAQDQLQRLLWLIPAAGRREGVGLPEAAERLGVEVEQIQKDLHALTTREFYHPGGTAEHLTVEITDRIRIHTTGQFARPPRLTAAELVCVLLGLRRQRGDHAELVARLEAKLAMPAVGGSVGGEGAGDSASPEVAVPDLEDGGRADAALAVLRRLRAQRRPCVFGYLKPGAEAPEIRRLHCYALVHAEGRWYAAGHDPDADGHRNFRLDRILGVTGEGEPGAYEVPEDFDAGALLEGARLFRLPPAGEAVEVEVRYGPRAAPWAREQWVGTGDADGGYRVRHAVGDPDWLVGHVLGHGVDAEILRPPELRDLVLRAAEGMAG
ncbi:MAG TPA: WYL domain-containing protein [Longimicrobiales bacterium]|nr:WYL domain-containing protein [Longimicrobiales bacterium]